jgi:hypothetical protein
VVGEQACEPVEHQKKGGLRGHRYLLFAPKNGAGYRPPGGHEVHLHSARVLPTWRSTLSWTVKPLGVVCMALVTISQIASDTGGHL